MQPLIAASYALLAILTVAPNFVAVPLYANILITSFCIIYIGSHGSLSRDGETTDTMSSKDAWMFPVFASCALFGLYLVFKYLHKDYINVLISIYFLFLGTFALEAAVHPWVRPLFPEHQAVYSFSIGSIPKFIHEKGRIDVKFSNSNVLSTLIAGCLAAWYSVTKHWCANNLLGIAFSIEGIKMLALGSYKIGAILLSLLFVYDVFWVFGTDVMVTVAKSFDGPIKLLFMRVPATADTAAQFSMLGLGDIVIPGIFIALLLRFDALRAGFDTRVARSSPVPHSFPKPYFNSCMVAYTLGLLTTLLIMMYFNAAQPALLYLVPACLGSSLGLATLRKELAALFEYSEEEEEAAGGAKAAEAAGEADTKKTQ